MNCEFSCHLPVIKRVESCLLAAVSDDYFNNYSVVKNSGKIYMCIYFYIESVSDLVIYFMCICINFYRTVEKYVRYLAVTV